MVEELPHTDPHVPARCGSAGSMALRWAVNCSHGVQGCPAGPQSLGWLPEGGLAEPGLSGQQAGQHSSMSGEVGTSTRPCLP